MKCNELAVLVVAAVLLFHAPSSSLAQHQQQPQQFNQNQMGQDSQHFQPTGFGHGGKSANSLDMNNNVRFQHVRGPVQGVQQGQHQPQHANMGPGTQPPQQTQPQNGNRVRGGGPGSGGVGMGMGGVSGNGNGRLPGQPGPAPLRNGGNGNGRPMEQQQQQPQQATFLPSGPMGTTISIGLPQTQSPASSSSTHFSGPNNSNGQGQAQGSQEKAKGQANSGAPATFPQSNSNGMSVHNSNLPNLATNTFGMPVLNSWNSQPHLTGNNVGETPKGSGQRFKVTTVNIQNGEAKHTQQNTPDFNKPFTPFQPSKETFGAGPGVGGFKFPVDDVPVQDNRFGPHNDGFGNTGAASTTINFGVGAPGSMSANTPFGKSKGKNSTLKKGKFSWTSPDGQVYEVSYVADLKDDSTGAAPKSTSEDSGFYKSTFPYPTNSNMIPMSESPRNGLEQLFGSGSAPPADYLVHSNSRGGPFNGNGGSGGGNGFMMPSPPMQQRFVPSRGF